MKVLSDGLLIYVNEFLFMILSDEEVYYHRRCQMREFHVLI